MLKPLNKLTIENVKIEIVAQFIGGKELNYVLGWLKGINEDSIFTDKGYEWLQLYAIETFLFRLKESVKI